MGVAVVGWVEVVVGVVVGERLCVADGRGVWVGTETGSWVGDANMGVGPAGGWVAAA